MLDINGSVLNVYQENQDYGNETKLGNIVDQLNTKIMFSDLNTEYLTKLEKDTKYLLKITNLKVNPGSYQIKFNLPQITSKPAVSEPLFIKEIDDTDTYNYQFKLDEIIDAGISHIKLDWKNGWGKEHLLFIRNITKKPTNDLDQKC